MKDRHLNIFYSYNHALIENNMTRSFIVTLRSISPELRKVILTKLFTSHFKSKNVPNYKRIEFALQEKIPIEVRKLRRISHKYLVALTADNIIEDLDIYRDPSKFNEVSFSPYIKPDAWIFDELETPQFCFLIECKTVGERLRASQIIAYGKYFFGIDSFREIEKRLIKVMWYDVLEICAEIFESDFLGNRQEKCLLQDLIDYLGFCHVIRFTGFDFSKIPVLPGYKFEEYIDFNFSEILGLPSYEIDKIIDLGLSRIPVLPNYRIL